MSTQASIFASPLPGKVIKILAHEGDFVEQGQGVFVLESMKMLHTLQAEKRGYMRHLTVQEGDIVSPNRQLARVM